MTAPIAHKPSATLMSDVDVARRIFDPQLVDNLIRTKRQEMAHFAEMTPEEQIDHYLDLV